MIIILLLWGPYLTEPQHSLFLHDCDLSVQWETSTLKVNALQEREHIPLLGCDVNNAIIIAAKINGMKDLLRIRLYMTKVTPVSKSTPS